MVIGDDIMATIKKAAFVHYTVLLAEMGGGT